ncbi:hypothetical protein Tco_0841023 [Tanacetum coccineum]|uniref:MAK10-like protein n=1 Tax=Tanacetum coccineum TaxID=301880 RepID=A0ABQ5AV71_9ASTR
MNTIELPVGNNVVPFLSDTIRLVQNGCSFQGLWSEDPNQHLKDFLKLVDSLDLDDENRKRTRKLATGLNVFQQDPSPHKRILLFISLLNSFHQEGLQNSQRYPDVQTTSRRISLGSMDSFQGLTLKSPSSWHRSLAPIQCLMEAHLAPMQPTQVNKITSSCEICSGPHDTQYCMENPEQAFVEYASSITDEARGMKREIEWLDVESTLDLVDTIKMTMIEDVNPSDLEDGFYRDTIKLGLLYLMRRNLEVLRKFHLDEFWRTDLTSYRIFLLHYKSKPGEF